METQGSQTSHRCLIGAAFGDITNLFHAIDMHNYQAIWVRIFMPTCAEAMEAMRGPELAV
jgi:hypothetical protein